MIRNANSAIERVRNQLSYKLGQAMIASSKAAEGGGGITLPFINYSGPHSLPRNPLAGLRLEKKKSDTRDESN